MSSFDAQINQAVTIIEHAGIIAYPTEAVFGLGCDFRSEAAVKKLLRLKNRPVKKGLILIASHIQQILPLIKLSEQNHLAHALKTWPGHNTWVFEKSPQVPDWISGEHQSVAVRLSAHPTVVAICDALNSAMVSTSANPSNEAAFSCIQGLKEKFKDQIDYYVPQALGGLTEPSTIRMAHNQQLIR